jgi:type I restriction enzyme R subunit
MTIDGQLAQAGWLVQSRDQMDLGAGLGVAVREFATASGPVDYALFVGRSLCGVIEAKPEGTTLSGFSDQATRYMGGVPQQLVRREDRCASNTSPSAPRSCSAIMPIRCRARAGCFSFHGPETLRRWLDASMTIRGHLQSMPPLLTERLRDCQIDAVTNLEAPFAVDHPAR